MNTKLQRPGNGQYPCYQAKGKFILKAAFAIALFLIFYSNLFSQVGISTTSITPNSSSILELRSTTLGFLPPRMTTTERDAISTPATGLVIYNTSTDLLNYYDGSAWQAPAGGTRVITLGSDVVNNNSTANTLADVTGLSFTVTAGITYRFRALIIYTAAATTTGSRWSINGPASPTLLAYNSTYPNSAIAATVNYNVAYNLPAASNTVSPFTTGNIAQIDGIIKPSANGTVVIRFASEIANSAITAKAGSTITVW